MEVNKNPLLWGPALALNPSAEREVVRVGGWVDGDQKCPWIFLKFGYSNKHDVLIPNMASKIVYCYKTKSYEKIKFEKLRFLVRFPDRKTAKNNDAHKRPLRGSN